MMKVWALYERTYFNRGNVLYKGWNTSCRVFENFEMAAKVKNRFATQKLANMFEEGIHKVDSYGNKGTQVVAPDFEKAEFWYQKLSDMGYPEGDAGVKRVQKRITNK